MRRVTPSQDRLDRYARLIVELGLGMVPGQDVFIDGHFAHAPLIRALARVAYRRGARHVDVRYLDPHVTMARVELSAEEALAWTPPWMVRRLQYAGEHGGAYLVVAGDPEPDLFAGADARRLGMSRPLPLMELSARLVGERLVNWCIAAGATPGWAASIFGEPDEERLWRAIERAVRLDAPDPVAAWRDHLAALGARAGRLQAEDVDAIRFRGPGTDLSIGLLRSSRWLGAEQETAGGIRHVPNLPTEEVFTTPDPRRVEGRVRATRPLEWQNRTITGLEVAFAGGRVTDVRAGAGEDLMRELVATDDGAARLGEVALVDGASRVGELGVTFRSTLFDENATCHIALGKGFEYAVGAEDEARVNQSHLHLDFMIGGPEVDVDAVLRDGRALPLLHRDRWMLDG